ncbi:MAG: thioredoxin family protein [Solirubrobacterales bacterium]
MVEEQALEIGDEAPHFELADTAGELVELPEPGEAQATVVVWTCNHCPYALAWHDRICEVAREYRDAGVEIIAINSNDADRYPADSPERMRERVESEDWPMPYLHDADQAVASEWGARVTPDLFVLDGDRRLSYRGAADGDHQDPSQRALWLRGAVESVLSGEAPDPAETEPVGCSIKWRPGGEPAGSAS